MGARRPSKFRLLRQTGRFVAVEIASRWASLSRTSTRELRPQVHILLMHDLRDQHVDRFRGLLAELSKQYEFVAYSDAVQQITHGDIQRPCLAFSFDDGLAGCRAAAAVLEEFGARGMFFVCPAIVAASPKLQAQFCRQRLWLRPRPFLTWNEIEQLMSRGHEIGCHTMTHIDIGQTVMRTVRRELAEARHALQARLGACRHFAWPYGRFQNFHVEAWRLVRELGFISCASGVRGSHGPTAGPVELPCLRRDSIDLEWPMHHIQFFLDRSAADPMQDLCWPTSLWGPQPAGPQQFHKQAA